MDMEPGEVSDPEDAPKTQAPAAKAQNDKTEKRMFPKTMSLMETGEMKKSPPPALPRKNKNLSKYADLGWGDMVTRPRPTPVVDGVAMAPRHPPSPRAISPDDHRGGGYYDDYRDEQRVRERYRNGRAQIQNMSAVDLCKEGMRLYGLQGPMLGQLNDVELQELVMDALLVDVAFDRNYKNREKLLEDMKAMYHEEENKAEKLIEDLTRPSEHPPPAPVEQAIFEVKRFMDNRRARDAHEDQARAAAAAAAEGRDGEAPHMSHPYAAPAPSFNPAIPPPLGMPGMGMSQGPHIIGAPIMNVPPPPFGAFAQPPSFTLVGPPGSGLPDMSQPPPPFGSMVTLRLIDDSQPAPSDAPPQKQQQQQHQHLPMEQSLMAHSLPPPGVSHPSTLDGGGGGGPPPGQQQPPQQQHQQQSLAPQPVQADLSIQAVLRALSSGAPKPGPGGGPPAPPPGSNASPAMDRGRDRSPARPPPGMRHRGMESRWAPGSPLRAGGGGGPPIGEPQSRDTSGIPSLLAGVKSSGPNESWRSAGSGPPANESWRTGPSDKGVESWRGPSSTAATTTAKNESWRSSLAVVDSASDASRASSSPSVHGGGGGVGLNPPPRFTPMPTPGPRTPPGEAEEEEAEEEVTMEKERRAEDRPRPPNPATLPEAVSDDEVDPLSGGEGGGGGGGPSPTVVAQTHFSPPHADPELPWSSAAAAVPVDASSTATTSLPVQDSPPVAAGDGEASAVIDVQAEEEEGGAEPLPTDQEGGVAEAGAESQTGGPKTPPME